MMTPKDIHLQKWMDAFAKLNLAPERLTAIEAYLKGEAELEALEQFPFQDLSGVSCPEFTAQMNNDLGKHRYEEAGRAYNAVFSIGQSTCLSLLKNTAISQLPGVEPEKTMVIHAEMAGSESWRLGAKFIESNLIETAKTPQSLLKAAEYSRQQGCNGRILLWACYFLKKYPNRDLSGDGQNASGGLLSGIGRIFSKKEPELVAEEDQSLLRKYENTVIVNMEEIIGCDDPQVEKDVLTALKENRVDHFVLQGAKKCVIKDKFLLELIGGAAYLNFPLSEKFKNAVKILLAADAEKTLMAMKKISQYLNTGKMDVTLYGGHFDKVFEVDPKQLIAWAVRWNADAVLRDQLVANQAAFLEVMYDADLTYSNNMMLFVQKEKPLLFQEIVKKQSEPGGNAQEKKKLIAGMLRNMDPSLQPQVQEFLQGEQPVSVLYGIHGRLSGSRCGGGVSESQMKNYAKHSRDQELIVRCLTLRCFQGEDYFMTYYLTEGGKVSEKLTKEVFEGFEKEGLELSYQIGFAAMIYDYFYTEDRKKHFFQYVTSIFGKYLADKREETAKAFQEAGATGRYLGLLVYGEDPKTYQEEILRYAQDSSKLVKERFIRIACGQPEWLEEIKGFLASKKAAEREMAVQILVRWDDGKGNYNELLKDALAKEKSAKIVALLEKALNLESGAGSGGSSPAAILTLEDKVKDLHKGGKKRSLAWAYENRAPYSVVHRKDGSEATQEYLQAILLCYQSMSPCGVSVTAKELAKELNENELACYVGELFDRWMEDGAESKKRWVLYAASIHGGAEIIEKLKHQINEWPQNARGAIAAEAVQALALNPQPQALLTVDGISRKFKFKQVKEAAGKALEYAAAQLGLTTEELSDKIVPDLGFDEKMERQFDYGERKFTVTITTALEIEIFDDSGKKVKSMPAPGKKDDEEKANAAYEEFKQLKKQMKATVSSQKMRLELALSAERQWTTQAWKDLFVKNPVMHQFAIGLIWGLYENGALKQSFRYMEDGSFNTQDEEEFAFPEEGKIGLVHPIELTKEAIEAWKQQLEDYEIEQPIEQLSREIFYITEEERNSKSMERYGGYILNALSLQGKLQGSGWYRGSVQDAGGFDTFYREDASVGLGAELHFSGTYVGVGYDEEVTVYDVRFYRAGTIRRGSYLYEEADDQKAVKLGEVPARYFSEIVLQLKKATASSQERDEKWKKNVR